MAERIPFSIDLAELLRPVSPAEPAGEWLRYEGTYDAVAEARREDDESLPQGIWQAKSKRADWPKVEATCQKALCERTKDLQLAVWLTEAWLNIYGPAGLVGGLRLCSGLLSQFWPQLYPLVEDSDPSYRLAPLEFLDRRIAELLKLMPLTDAEGLATQYSFADWERALRNDRLTGQAGAEELLPATVLSAAGATPPAAFSRLHSELLAVEDACSGLETVLVGFVPDRPGALRAIHNVLRDIRGLIAQYTPAAAPPAESAAPNDAAQATQAAGKTAMRDGAATEVEVVVGPSSGPIRSRVEAYQRLVEAADFLMRTEPHSPVPYLVRRAVSWGNMSLLQLLAELVASDAERQPIFSLLGMKTPHSQG